MYRRNADENLRYLERQTAEDPTQGLRLYLARRRVGISPDQLDYEALAGYEIFGGEIPYEIELQLEFPYVVARRVWDERPSLQAWYRLNKIQRDAWDIARVDYLHNLGVEWDEDDHYSIPAEIRRGPLRDYRRNFLVELSDDDLADLWVTDIESRLYRIRRQLSKGIYAEHQQTTDGLIEKKAGKYPELVRLKYDISVNGDPSRLENGSMFILHYGRECCYDTPNYYGGTVHIQVFGLNYVSGQWGGSGNKAGMVDFSIIEYGRHHASLIPQGLLGRGADWVAEEHKIDYNTYGIISGACPSSYTPSEEECRNRDIPPAMPLRAIVNGEHLFDLIRDKYNDHIPRYKEIFEREDANKKLMASMYYHPRFPHIWQISRLVQNRIALLDILDIPHTGGKIPGSESGEYYFQQYKFILYPSRGKPGKRKDDRGLLMRLYIECPFTGREIPTGRWTQYAPTLLRD